MWFKNLSIYTLNPEFVLPEIDKLNRLLSEFRFVPCGKTDKQKYGWVSPNKSEDLAVIPSGVNAVHFTAKLQTKPIPSETIREALNLRVQTVEELEGRPLRKLEKETIKSEVIDELLPQAFPRDKFHNFIIFPDLGILVSDQASRNNTENALALLRKTLGSLPVIPMVTKVSPSVKMTEWLVEGNCPFTVLDSVKLCDSADPTRVVTTKELDTDIPVVQSLLNQKFFVDQLALASPKLFSFVALADGDVRRIKWSEELTGHNDDYDQQDQDGRDEADRFLQANVLSQWVPAWVKAFGGLKE